MSFFLEETNVYHGHDVKGKISNQSQCGKVMKLGDAKSNLGWNPYLQLIRYRIHRAHNTVISCDIMKRINRLIYEFFLIKLIVHSFWLLWSEKYCVVKEKWPAASNITIINPNLMMIKYNINFGGPWFVWIVIYIVVCDWPLPSQSTRLDGLAEP